MKRWPILFFALLAAACSASPTPVPSASPTPTEQPYPDLGAAPELAGDTWLNSDTALRLADLRGKVVLVDMWTFG